MRVLIFFCILSLPALCSAQQVYKWRDKYGNMHYSDVEPPAQNAQRKVVKGKDPAPAQKKMPTENEIACERAKQNLTVLSTREFVDMDLNNDGKTERLTSEQRAQQTAAMEAAVKAKCSP